MGSESRKRKRLKFFWTKFSIVACGGWCGGGFCLLGERVFYAHRYMYIIYISLYNIYIQYNTIIHHVRDRVGG